VSLILYLKLPHQGIADDTYIVAACDIAVAAFKLKSQLEGEQLGLRSRADKSFAFARDPSKLSESQRELLAAENIPLTDGLLCVGIPIGTDTYVRSELDKTVGSIREKALAIAATNGTNPNATQATFTSACLGLASMFTHLLRSLPPETVAMHARQVDDIATECARSILKLEHVKADSDAGRELQERLFLQTGGMGMMSCANTADAAFIGHWALVGPTVQKMLPHVPLVDANTMDLPPLVSLSEASTRVATVTTDKGIKTLVTDLARLLSNSQRGIQGVISKHLGEIALTKFTKSMPRGTDEEKARLRAFISGSCKYAAAGVHASRRNRMLRLTGDEFRATCALRLGVDAFPQPSMAITCPDCHSVVSDRTAHALACSAAQDKRTMLHTAMEVAARTLLRELDDELVVTGSKGAYPFDHGFKVSEQYPGSINHHADAFVFDTATGTSYMIDYTFTNAAKSTGTMNGAEPGSHATKEEDSKFKEYKKQFPDLSEKSSPTSLVIIAMERHGSWGKRTCAYWNGLVDLAHEREKKKEFPTHKFSKFQITD